ncbi:protein PHYTOCHROME KINASE SUBSTRATE 1-like [Impatiens glandulifera]|uniref:protein PHYTOCHROME KINASE SUBSTRATE 1-like n=1 Tax=Impatiens glandulifera TaxID=253017 RepID=UPI001FB0CECB|nr:protein PHYTOCHROME KINASE SUBSTRATE 1-like [Impatiens glandulifera]
MATLRPENNTIPLPRNASFSSYLNSTEETFIKNLSDSVRKPYPDGKKTEDGEIDVFEAEKYFNGAIDDHEQQSSKLSTIINGPNKHEPDQYSQNKQRTRVQFGTPSVNSESSWNSSSVLLQPALKNQTPPLPPQMNKNNNLKTLISNLRCNYCLCNDKNSVQVYETSKSINEKTTARDQSTQSSSYLSQSNTKSRTNPWLINRDQDQQQQQQTMQRKSLEVFGLSVERRIPVKPSVIVTHNQPSTSIQEPCMIGQSHDGTYDETGSDASSDLFEIESFTTNTINTPKGYAPSEASVEWSVVTASMADFSALSDSEDARTMSFSSNTREMVSKQRNIPAKETERQRSGILLGCKNYKAVRVAEDAYRTSTKLGPNGSCRMHDASLVRVLRVSGENWSGEKGGGV